MTGPGGDRVEGASHPGQGGPGPKRGARELEGVGFILRNVNLATLDTGNAVGRGAPRSFDPGYGALPGGALVVEGGRITWVGRERDLPARPGGASGGSGGLPELDGGGGWGTPGLVDCHTHLVWAGSRGAEFEERLAGVPYETIARRGGGIRSTMEATRRATLEELVRAGLRRLDALAAEGATTVEVKSGYGLEPEAERRLLQAARELGRLRPLSVTTTFLGAHAVPPGFEGRSDAYLDEVAQGMLPALHREGLVDAVDVFCEGVAFSVEQADRLFRAAGALGLPVKAHAEQLSLLGGAALVARHRGLSADHLEYLDDHGVEAMAAAGTVAVLLPGAFHTLRETRTPPVEALRKAGVPMAVATDANPGTSPLLSVRLAMNLAVLRYGLTPAEALAGATREGARALGMQDRGRLAPGLRGDVALWAVDHPADLVALMGGGPLEASWVEGRELFRGAGHLRTSTVDAGSGGSSANDGGTP